MYHARITVTLRKTILDPQGKAIEHALHSLNLNLIEELRVGKHIEMNINTNNFDEAKRITEEACKQLLGNPVMEDFKFTIEEIK
ncbi:MAG: phosphoribosylformylglycinamidine synthase subunit PurS [Bacteroidota bacterium]